MAQGKQISEVLLRYDLDERSVSDSLKAADAMLQRFKRLQTQAGELGTAVSGLRQAQDLQSRGLDETGVAATRASRNLQEVIDRQKQAASTARGNKKEIDAYAEAMKAAAKETRSFGDVQSRLTSLAGSLRGVGLGSIGDILGTGADISGTIEDINRIGPSLREAGKGALTAVNNITGLDLSLGQLGLLAGGAGIAITAVVAGISSMFERLRAEGERFRQEEEARRAGEAEATQELATMTTAEREAEVEAVRSSLDAQNEIVVDSTQQALALAESLRGQTGMVFQAIHGELADGVDTIAEAQTVFNELKGTFLGMDVYASQLDESTRRDIEALGTYIGASQKAQTNVNQLGSELLRLTDAEADATVTTNDTRIAEEALAAARLKGENAAIEAATSAARAADEAAARATYQANLDAIDAVRELARFEEQLADVRKSSRQGAAGIREQARQRVDALTAQMVQAEAAAEKAIAKVQSDAAKKRAEVERDYMQETVDATRDYLDEERKAQEDYSRDRVRRLEDMYDDLQSAEDENNVIRFIQIRRAGEKDLRRMDEDAAVDARRRSEEFQAENAQREQEAEQRLADLQDDSAERIAEIREGLREQRRAYEEQVRQEQATMKERLRLNQQGLIAELDVRRKAHAISLQEEAVYANQRLALQERLDAALLAIASRSYSGAAIKATGYANLTASKSLAGATSGRSLVTTSAVSPVFNISMGNIGSNISKGEVAATVTTAVKASYAATIAAMSGGK